jgi:hypothetical protein
VKKAEAFGYAAGWKEGLMEALDENLSGKPVL